MVFLLLPYTFCTFQIFNAVFLKFPAFIPQSHKIDNYMRIYLEFRLHFETMNGRLPKTLCLYLIFFSIIAIVYYVS